MTKHDDVRKYWYLTTTYECPLCGGGETFRERVHTEKPTDPNERYSYKEYYDYCDV